MNVDVIIPTRDTRELTLSCVASVLADGPPLDGLCVVVDNGSGDGTAAAVESLYPDVSVLRNETNAGFGTACNQGARAGSAEFLLILNSDVQARPGAISRLAAFLSANPAYGAVGGRLVDPGTDDTQVGFNVRSFPTVTTQLALMLGLERAWPGNPVSRRQRMTDLDYGRTQEVAQPAGACLMCRRRDFEAIGGFDERYWYWFEDVDLARRLHDRGKIAYVHDAVFEHEGGASFASWDRALVIRTRYRSLLRYFRAHHPARDLAAMRVAIVALSLPRAIAWLPFDRGRARAYRDVARVALTGGPR